MGVVARQRTIAACAARSWLECCNSSDMVSTCVQTSKKRGKGEQTVQHLSTKKKITAQSRTSCVTSGVTSGAGSCRCCCGAAVTPALATSGAAGARARTLCATKEESRKGRKEKKRQSSLAKRNITSRKSNSPRTLARVEVGADVSVEASSASKLARAPHERRQAEARAAACAAQRAVA